jgi:hypothetical protein
MENSQVVEKATITSSDIASAGKMNPQQADKFIDYVFEETMLQKNARTIKFSPETLVIDKIGVGRRVAVAATEASDPAVRRGITTTKITLQPKEVMVPFELSDTFKEINLEGPPIEDHIIRMMATTFANDLEDFYINGNAFGPAIREDYYRDGGDPAKWCKDGYLGLGDGWLQLAEGGHRHNISNANIALGIFSAMLNKMPNKFKRDRSRLRFLCCPEIEQLYREKVATRLTPKGDATSESSDAMSPFGIKLVPVPLLAQEPSITQHVAVNTDGTTATPLKYAPITNVVVTPSTLGSTAATPYLLGTDYSQDLANGTITRLTGGSIASGATVKVTYQSKARILLTHFENFIVGIGRDIRIEKDRDIYRRVNMYAITAKVCVQIEETDALVDGYNLGLAVS